MNPALLFFLLDFGTPKSPVMTGWTAVTKTTLATATAPGWVAAPEAKDYDQAFGPTERDGRPQPPAMYTNDVTRDGLTGSTPATLRLPLTAGDYELWVCGGTTNAPRGALYDFTVGAGAATASFQMQGGRWLETRRLRFHADGPTDVAITPKSQWAISGLAVYPVAQAAEAAKQLQPIDDSIYFVPPEEQANWKYEPHKDPVGKLPEFAAADRQRGYVVHHRHYLENVYPDTVPYPETFNPTLRAFATLGEYEPLTFTVYALQPLTGCKVAVSALTGPGTIPASEVDVKLVQFARSRPNYTVVGRYRIVPDYLRPFDTVDVPANENQRFWLTVHVPDGAKAGVYRGQATFTPAGRPAATVPIEFRVLDIQLRQDPAKCYGMYYYDPLDQYFSATDDAAKALFLRRAENEGADMVAHGTVMNVPLGTWVQIEKDPAKPIAFTYDWDRMVKKLDRCKRYGWPGPYVIEFNAMDVYARNTGGARAGSHISGIKPGPEAYANDITTMVKWFEENRKRLGLPEFIYYPIDEPGESPEAVAFMVQTMKAIRAAGPGVRTYVTADPTHEAFAPMKPYVDVWSTQPFLPSREEVLKDMAERQVEYWCYPNHINGENDHTTVAGARFTYGFGFWRSGFLTLNPWIYSSTGSHPFNNLDGTAADFFNRPGPDGTVWPVPMWEAYREGYDDYRYVYTLSQWIAAATKAGKTGPAKTAQAVLDATWKAIDVKPKYKEDADVWGYREFDARRWQLAEQILALKQACGK